jgi:hypothetical protein
MELALEVLGMPVAENTEERIPVTLSLPKPVLDRVSALARHKHSTVELELQQLVENGILSSLSVRERLEALSDSYRERLSQEGRLNQSAEEVMEELRRIREQVADELHPD